MSNELPSPEVQTIANSANKDFQDDLVDSRHLYAKYANKFKSLENKADKSKFKIFENNLNVYENTMMNQVIAYGEVANTTESGGQSVGTSQRSAPASQ